MAKDGHVRYDKYDNLYVLPEHQINEFDRDCDEAVAAESDEALGLWIDIKTKYKGYLMEMA